jgi:hypothetical protein
MMSPSPIEFSVIRPVVWLACAASISTAGYWLPAFVGFILIPEDPDYRGFFITIIFLPVMFGGSIWSFYCIRLIWFRTQTLDFAKYLYRSAATILLLLVILPICHFIYIACAVAVTGVSSIR